MAATNHTIYHSTVECEIVYVHCIFTVVQHAETTIQGHFL